MVVVIDVIEAERAAKVEQPPRAPSRNSTTTRLRLVAEQLGILGLRRSFSSLRIREAIHEAISSSDGRGDHDRQGQVDRRERVVDGVDHAAADEDAHQQRDRPPDRGERVGDGEILVRDGADDRGGGREEEAVHGQDEKRTRIEQDGLAGGIEEHQSGEPGLDPKVQGGGGFRFDLVDEDPRTVPGSNGGAITRVAFRKPTAVLWSSGEEGDRRSQRRLEEPVRGLASEPDPDQLAEVGARDPRINAAFPARCSPGRGLPLVHYASADRTSKNRVQS